MLDIQDPQYTECYKCGFQPHRADIVVPITYSIGGEQMHYSLRQYKDGATAEIRNRMKFQIAAVLWRFLRDHEACVAAAAGIGRFDLVTVVPSGTTTADDARPQLRDIVGEIVRPTAERFERLLAPSDSAAPSHQFDHGRFKATRPVDAKTVLLIDDTWTTGASVQSAAGALKSAGAARVAAIVVGRHINREHGTNVERLKALPKPFDWDTCAVH